MNMLEGKQKNKKSRQIFFIICRLYTALIRLVFYVCVDVKSGWYLSIKRGFGVKGCCLGFCLINETNNIVFLLNCCFYLLIENSVKIANPLFIAIMISRGEERSNSPVVWMCFCFQICP